MATISTIRVRGNSYTIIVSAPDEQGGRKRHYKTVKRDPDISQKDWEKKLQSISLEFECNIRDNLYLREGKITFREFVFLWRRDYANKYLAPKTLQRYESMLSRILVVMGHLQLSKIRPTHLHQLYKNLEEGGVKVDKLYYPTEPFLNYLSKNGMKAKEFSEAAGIEIKTARNILKGQPTSKAKEISIALQLYQEDCFKQRTQEKLLSNRTILHHHRLISSILEKAVKWQFITENPARRAEAPKVKQREILHYDAAGLMKVLSLLENEPIKYKAWIYTTACSGCRLGELGGLKWEDINFENNSIHIRRSLQSLPQKGTFLKEPKNESSRRIVVMPQIAMDILKEYKCWQDNEKVAMGDMWIDLGMVFSKANGDLMYAYTPSQWFTKFRRKHDLPDVTFHGLRHSNAAILIAEGVDIQTLAGRLGHSRPTTTTDVYSHFLQKPNKIAAEKLEEKLKLVKEKKGAGKGKEDNI